MAFHESREDPMWTAWEDYATAGYTVRVRDAESTESLQHGGKGG